MEYRNSFLNPYLNLRMPAEREEIVRVFIPAIFGVPGKVLYIGAKPDSFSCGPMLYEEGHEITVVEIWPPYIEHVKGQFGKYFDHIVHGDVRQIDKVQLPYGQYDFTFWLHGPEHIERRLFRPTVKKLERLTRKIIVLASPWGKAPWPAEDGNPHQEHVSTLYPRDYARMGYRLVAIWPENQPGSHIMAWKEL